jgi:hypothetical protein
MAERDSVVPSATGESARVDPPRNLPAIVKTQPLAEEQIHKDLDCSKRTFRAFVPEVRSHGSFLLTDEPTQVLNLI